MACFVARWTPKTKQVLFLSGVEKYFCWQCSKSIVLGSILPALCICSGTTSERASGNVNPWAYLWCVTKFILKLQPSRCNGVANGFLVKEGFWLRSVSLLNKREPLSSSKICPNLPRLCLVPKENCKQGPVPRIYNPLTTHLWEIWKKTPVGCGSGKLGE